jgi:replication factor A1
MQVVRTEGGQKPVLGLKSVRIGDYNGRNLGTLNTSTAIMEPAVPETAQLRNWWVNSSSGDGCLHACLLAIT